MAEKEWTTDRVLHIVEEPMVTAAKIVLPAVAQAAKPTVDLLVDFLDGRFSRNRFYRGFRYMVFTYQPSHNFYGTRERVA